MVRKNVTVSKIENVTVIELGKGDTQCGVISSKNDRYVAVGFLNDVTNHPIGTIHATNGNSVDQDEVDAMITFTNVESIDVVMHYLKEARQMIVDGFLK